MGMQVLNQQRWQEYMEEEPYQAEIWRLRKIVQRMLLPSSLKAAPFADLDEGNDHVGTNEAAKDKEDET